MSKEFDKDIVKLYLISAGFPPPTFEYKFHHTRKWRFDIAWPAYKIAIEVQGGIWIKGRHSRGKGQINDMAKLNEAQICGWTVLQVTPKQLMTHYAESMLIRLFGD